MPPLHRPLRAAALTLVALAFGAATGARAEATSAPTGFRADWLSNFDEAAKKATDLAGALPGETMAWRPGEGVRSSGEVIAHLASANFLLPTFTGRAAPDGIGRDLESETDPARLRRLLGDSIAHLRTIVATMDDAELEQRVKIFGGREVTTRELLIIALGHLHEHLGQLVAYARANGIVPPWSGAG